MRTFVIISFFVLVNTGVFAQTFCSNLKIGFSESGLIAAGTPYTKVSSAQMVLFDTLLFSNGSIMPDTFEVYILSKGNEMSFINTGNVLSIGVRNFLPKMTKGDKLFIEKFSFINANGKIFRCLHNHWVFVVE